MSKICIVHPRGAAAASAALLLSCSALLSSCSHDSRPPSGSTVPGGDSDATGGGDASIANPAPQPPIRITFDLHCDPFPQSLTVEARRSGFRRQLDNATWLLDTVAPHGGRVSFLAVGEFYEFCVEPSESAACFPLLERLYASGGVIATHTHTQYRRGAHDWPDIPSPFDPSPTDARRVWSDAQEMTNEAIRQALGLTDGAAIAAVNSASNSHVQLPDATQLMEELGYTIREGGGDQVLVPRFGHVPWNPFRPSATSAVVEDLTTGFVTLPQGMVLGQTGLHAGHWQDGRPVRKLAELYELYVSWLEAERQGTLDKVWTFGWGLHTQDIDVGAASRAAVTELIPALAGQFTSRSSPLGNPVAAFAGYRDVGDAYSAWELEHPGTSSFSYAPLETSYADYPYLAAANRYLRATLFDTELPAPAGARLVRLTARGEPLLLAIAGAATTTFDATSLGAATVRRVRLADGMSTEVSAAAVAVEPGSAVLCVPSGCDAILALAPGASSDDCGGCSSGQVCCPAALPCAGQCLPDCRLPGSGCPAPPGPSQCDGATGLCEPASPSPTASRMLSVTNPASGMPWWVKAYYPADASASRRYPAVVTVPGGSGSGSATEALRNPQMNPASLAERGFVVVIFDADGRGNTAGVEDYCGFVHQDGLAAVIDAVAQLDVVDAAAIGLSTSSYGVTMGTGVLARHPSLPVRFLVDMEGPADRNDTGHCDSSNTGHITHDCTDEAWWVEREAVSFARSLAVPYLRLQHVTDHAQPDNVHAVAMIDGATGVAFGGDGSSPWTRVNSDYMNDPNRAYGGATPPVWAPDGFVFDLPTYWSEMLRR